MVKKIKKRIVANRNNAKNNSNSACNCTNLKINSFALAYTLAILSAGCMLILSLLGRLGYSLEAIEIMKAWHLPYSLSFWGIVGGMAEAALAGLVIGFIIGWIYNQFL